MCEKINIKNMTNDEIFFRLHQGEMIYGPGVLVLKRIDNVLMEFNILGGLK